MNNTKTKILLCKKDREFRLSILINKQERLFVKERDEETFLKNIEKGVLDRTIMDFPTIQNAIRCSKTQDFEITQADCTAVPKDLKIKVRRIFDKIPEPELI